MSGFLRCALLPLISGCLVVGAYQVPAGERRPNVLMILVDDLKPAMGCYGDPVAKTPNLDRLASMGTRFERAYCNQAVCAPSRFALLLGSHPTSSGLYQLNSQLRSTLPDATTLPQYFARYGYRTESLGKVFHIGHGNDGDPLSFSVPHFHDKVIEYADSTSTLGGQLTREEAYFANQHLGRIRELPRGAAFEAPEVDDDAYADGRVAKETVNRLRAAQQRLSAEGTPFFMVAGFARPHLPFSAPKRYWDLYDPNQLPDLPSSAPPRNVPSIAMKKNGELINYAPIPESGQPDAALAKQLVHGYYASISYVDAQIGRVIMSLSELGLSENTIVVLWGDHGFHLGDHGLWTKHTNFEQANRIPLIIVAPGVSNPGTSASQLSESVDVFPTLCDLCHLPDPHVSQPLDGISLVPSLRDTTKRTRDYAYHVFPREKLGRAIRTERYRLVEWRKPGEPESSALYELYDYQMDPNETTNIANEAPEIVRELLSRLELHPVRVPPR